MRVSRSGQALLKVVFSILLFSACHSRPGSLVDEISHPPTMGIINGVEVTRDEVLAKSTVLLVNRTENNQYSCTATLLGGPYALTAAHCLDLENPHNLYIFFDPRPSEKTERRQVIAQRASPYWGTEMYRKNAGDIAILKFEGDSLPSGYQGVEFLENPSLLRPFQNTLVLGYGLSGLALELEPFFALRKAVLPIAYTSYSATELLLDQTQGAQVALGDSGGPAFIMIHGKYYFWGLANREVILQNGTRTEAAVVFTNALLYRVWIQNVLRNL